VLVYIAEAHSYDEWPVGDHLLLGRRIFQPKHLEDRVPLAKAFVKEYGLEEGVELLVDDPALDSNRGFDATYAAWPTRFYVIEENRLTWIAQPDENHEYDSALSDLEQFAETLISA